MNKVILLVLLMPVTAFGQLMETFETGNMPAWFQKPEGRWNIDNINPVSGALSLHHTFDNQGSGDDRTGFQLKNLHPEEGDVRWSFKIRYGTDPSSTNNWTIYLMSDTDPASLSDSQNLNGFTIGVNQTGYDDTLRLWKARNGTLFPVISSGINWQTDVGPSEAVKIEAGRSAAGAWTLKVSTLTGSLIDSATGFDPDLFSPRCFVICYKYTSSRDRLIWLDDISIDGIFRDDDQPPEIHYATTGDVIISEIMADPVPPVNLPPEEYIEIFNRSGSEISLKGWNLVSGEQEYPFPGVSIDPGEYLIICSTRDTMLFHGWGRSAGFKTFPVLTDAGKLLALTDGSGNMIHGVEYSSVWYGNELKAEGGWSLEIKDPDHPFYNEGNWFASVSRDGGTPGKPNSVSQENPDPGFYGIMNVFPDDSINLLLSFSETVTEVMTNTGKIKVDDLEIEKTEPADILLRKYSVVLKEPLKKHKTYTLRAGEEIKDFSGNPLENSSFSFGIPEPASFGNILFNELLFNPIPGDPDFVELCNCSGSIIDVSRLILISVNDETGDTSGICYMSEENRCLLPGDFFVITTDRDLTVERYPSSLPRNIFQVSDLPSMSDDKGHLILLNRELELIDEVYYDENMHYSLLGGYEGISLERIRPQGPSTDRSLWHSASEASGWGTPGMQNSVFTEKEINDDRISLSSSRITPDNDGNDDFLVIDLKLIGTGNIVSVTVFDEAGGFVKKITDNLLAGPEASIIWNGTADDEKPVNNGIYILLISVFDENGKTGKWKKVCTVFRR